MNLVHVGGPGLIAVVLLAGAIAFFSSWATPPVAAAEEAALSAKQFITMADMKNGPGMRLGYVLGVSEAMLYFGLKCPDGISFNEMVAWTDVEIWRAGAQNSEQSVFQYVVKGMGEHGCRKQGK